MSPIGASIESFAENWVQDDREYRLWSFMTQAEPEVVKGSILKDILIEYDGGNNGYLMKAGQGLQESGYDTLLVRYEKGMTPIAIRTDKAVSPANEQHYLNLANRIQKKPKTEKRRFFNKIAA